ncbi:putative RNA-binding protein 19 [Trichoplax sp. H2]|nr:putative RNA-binding protein 19 [Trichoplax sp. H2]|eukprot:RDD47300.1 putative RNA-binding protein 19 [Trichoplax sp. H2]
MSRLVVKNLPCNISEDRLRALFSEFGELTDVQLKFTEDKIFRRFAFIGYRHKCDASTAQKFFNNSYIDTSKIEIEPCYPLNERIAARVWKKYSKRDHASTSKVRHEGFSRDTSKRDQSKVENLEIAVKKEQKSLRQFYEERTNITLTHDKNVPLQNKISEPMDKATVTANFETVMSKRSTDKGTLKNRVHIKFHEGLLVFTRCQTTDNTRSKVSNISMTQLPNKESDTEDNAPAKNIITIKLRGLPFDVNEEEIKEFFHPTKLENTRLMTNHKGKPNGVAFVDFTNEEDACKAMKSNKDYIRNRYIELFPDEGKHLEISDTPVTSAINSQISHETQEDSMKRRQESYVADIERTGRLFLRNLAYCCTENDIKDLLSNYGPLKEVHLPKSADRKGNIGFAFVKFATPADAIRAANDLDGAIFLGRIIHLLPGREDYSTSNSSNDNLETGSSLTSKSYKKNANSSRKKLSESPHNWNSLFLNQNAVLDALASKLDADKAKILDTEIDQSLAVRLALGETKLVADTRSFLMSHAVNLESLTKPCKERSKTVIIVKNLPFGTKKNELCELFSEYGSIERVIIPPSGITALVEYTKDIEARNGFRKLAYSKFKSSPLYLEWAPIDVFNAASGSSIDNNNGIDDSAKPPNCEILNGKVDAKTQNLQRTIFIRNLNFQTDECRLRKVYHLYFRLGSGLLAQLTNKLFQEFRKFSEPVSVFIPKKKTSNKPHQKISMGFGFIEYRNREDAERTIKDLQHCEVDGRRLELEISTSTQHSQTSTIKKNMSVSNKPNTTKILVKNLPFEATKSEVKQIFSVFGEIKCIRIPRKYGQRKQHRGFTFIEFITKADAKRAFTALQDSTHLYGRRLILQWAEEDQDITAIRQKTATKFFTGRPSKKVKLDYGE